MVHDLCLSSLFNTGNYKNGKQELYRNGNYLRVKFTYVLYDSSSPMCTNFLVNPLVTTSSPKTYSLSQFLIVNASVLLTASCTSLPHTFSYPLV